ncbi:MAG: nuclear transport factor 2 family protein [Thermoleophilaceae bacterium]|nr:nuclear transport factor 2 family protein [Thermoleophilaceae bacterium]
MSQANVEIVRRLYELWNGPRPAEALLPLFAQDVEYVNPPNAVEPGVRHGHDGFVAALASLDAAFDEYQHDLEELIDLGDRVLAWGTFRARATTGGLRYEQTEAQIWTLRDGLITRLAWFHDRAEALEAAGLSESGS